MLNTRFVGIGVAPFEAGRTLLDLSERAERVRAYTADLTFDQFAEDVEKQDEDS